MTATIDRIRKLLSLASNEAAAPNEADTARRLAERLMEAAGIAERDVLASMAGGEDPIATVRSEKMAAGTRKARTWEGIVAMAVGRIVGCYVYQSHTDEGHAAYAFIGTDSARAAGVEIHRWVIGQVEAYARGAAKIARLAMQMRTARSVRHYMSSWHRGFANAIAEQASSLVAARTSQRPTASAALVHQDRLAAAIERAKPDGLRTRHSSVRVNPGAYAAGTNDGRGVHLQRSAEAGAGLRRLGSG